MRVLVIEDEIRIARNITKVLDEECSWVVDICTDGEDGRHMVKTNSYDLIILDLGLPKISGMDILKDIRGAGMTVPVLILTARDTADDIVQGLETGSDDYMVKPFDMRELIARSKALIRRSYGQATPVLEIGSITVDISKHKVAAAGRAVRLSAMEYRLLEYLAMRAGEIVSKADIVEHLYDFGADKFSNVVEVYICTLRKKLGSKAEDEIIHTIRNQGYVLGDLPL